MNAVISYFTANNCAELIGTVANVFVIATFAIHGEKKMRTLSIIGSAISAVYNYLMHSSSFFILSCAIIIINSVNLIFLKPE